MRLPCLWDAMERNCEADRVNLMATINFLQQGSAGHLDSNRPVIWNGLGRIARLTIIVLRANRNIKQRFSISNCISENADEGGKRVKVLNC